MAQIGNLHIGKADSAKQPVIDIGEAFILSQQLYYRQYCIEQTELHYQFANDYEFKSLIKRGQDYIKKEAAEIEKQMVKYNVPQPSRSPKSVKISLKGNSITNDQYLYEQIRYGCKAAIENNLKNAFMIINNDSLRTMFVNFVKEEMDLLTNLIKYGKAKGWVPVYPEYKADN
jgi:hypothetical protein